MNHPFIHTKLLLFWFLLTCYTPAMAQKQEYDSVITAKPTAREVAGALLRDKLQAIDAEGKWYDPTWSLGNPPLAIVASFENNEDEVYVSEIKGRGYLVNGTAFVEFADVLIDETNANNYIYHVIKNDREEMVPWKKPDQFITTTDGKHSYAYLGKFQGKRGEQIKIEIYNTKNYADRSVMFIEWLDIIVPEITGDIEYRAPGTPGIFSAYIGGNSKYYTNYNSLPFIDTMGSDFGTVRLGDPILNFTARILSNPSLSTLVYLMKKTNGRTEKILLGGRYNKTVNISKELWKEPGKYQLEFVPYAVVKRSDRANKTGMYEREFPDKKFVYELTVLPDKNQSIEISISSIILIITVLLLLIIFFTILGRYRSRLKFEKVQRREAQAQGQLQSIRSQLNPHFIFNALSGIQTLMNKHETDTANEYLAKFARLTRRVLDDAGKDQVSLADEAALLDDYLKMEQLRFGFRYTVIIDNQLSGDTQIPAMLLQPLVENAVKHGIVDKKKEGMIQVRFSKSGDDLVLQVTDNGEGFDKKSLVEGKGLELTQNRVSLSNTIYRNTPLSFTIEPGNMGTTATIHLKNWLS